MHCRLLQVSASAAPWPACSTITASVQWRCLLRPRLPQACRLQYVWRTAASLPAQASTTASDLFSSLPCSAQSQLDTYLHKVLEQNRVMNLTAIRDPAEAHKRHIGDSLTLLPLVQQHVGDQAPLRMLDVGTGAGFPGVVLAIARPSWQVVLLDSVRKRCNFVESTCRSMGLANVTVCWGRAEELAHDEAHREGYNVVTARAVAELRTLAEYCLPFVSVGGVWLAMKGPQPGAELTAAAHAVKLLGGGTQQQHLVDSFAEHGQRTVVVVRKSGATPHQYPRQHGAPRKMPL